MDRTLNRSLPLKALEMTFSKGKTRIHHSDQGVQYASQDYIERLQQNTIAISMSQLDQQTQNAYAERFMRTFKEGLVDYSEYTNLADARHQIGAWIEDYLTGRIHSALGYLTPAEF